jgi:hypothetical protein
MPPGEAKMKVRVTLMAALLAGASGLAAAEPGREIAHEKALMLYVSKSFGRSQRQLPAKLQLGLKLQQTRLDAVDQSFDLLDLRFARGAGMTLTAVGALRLRAFGDDENGRPSSSSSSFPAIQEHPVIATAVVVGVVGAGLCLARKIICEKKSSRYELTESPGLPGGPG